MKNSVKNNGTKNVVTNVVTENAILEALNNAKKSDAITLKEIERKAKQLAKDNLKTLRKEKTQAKKEIAEFWLYQTRSKNAVKKFFKDNDTIMMPYIDKINGIYDTTFDIGVINGTLEKFAYIHELNKVDVDGKIIDEKNDVVNINFYLNLLERKAKFVDYNNSDFSKVSNKALLNKCLSSTKNQIAKIMLLNKAELSQANYNKAKKIIDSADTSNMVNSALIYFIEKTFIDVLTPIVKRA